MGHCRCATTAVLLLLLCCARCCTCSVLQFHNDSGHTGFYAYVLNASLSQPDTEFRAAAQVSGSIYGSLLFYQPNGLVIASTEDGHVTALNSSTGATVWDAALAQPFSAAALPCGSIRPNVGVTGTPVIDATTGTLYVDTLTSVAGNSSAPRHLVFAVNVTTGATLSGWPVDVAAALAAQFQASVFNSSVQNQRGALAVLGGILYVPYGGFDGDCGDYHGWVLGINTSHPTGPIGNYTTAALKGGIWAPGGVASDGQSLFVATGNTDDAVTWGGGEAVLRLGPGPTFSYSTTDFGAPTNWQSYDLFDWDLSASAPVLLDLPGSQPSQLVFVLGKDGIGYLFDRNNLGGFGGWVFNRTVMNTNSGSLTSPALYTTAAGTYLALHGFPVSCPPGSPFNASQSDLLALLLIPGSPPSFNVSWCVQQGGAGSPIATHAANASAAVVWSVGSERSNALGAWDGDTGANLFTGQDLGFAVRFHTPIATPGAIYYGVTGGVVKYNVYSPVLPAVVPQPSAPPDGSLVNATVSGTPVDTRAAASGSAQAAKMGLWVVLITVGSVIASCLLVN